MISKNKTNKIKQIISVKDEIIALTNNGEIWKQTKYNGWTKLTLPNFDQDKTDTVSRSTE